MRLLARSLVGALAAAFALLGAACDDRPVATPEPLPTSAQTSAPSSAPLATSEVAQTATAAPTGSEPPAANGASGAPAASVEPLPPGVTGGSLAEKAEKCWASATCPLEEAARDFQRADDAGATPMDCFRFYYAMGVPGDPQRARRCFERHVNLERGCGQQSPSFDRIYLVAMLLDGQGGPRALDRGKALLADCYDDVSVIGLRDEIEAREGGDSPGKTLDFCEDIGGTTLSMQMCAYLSASKGDFEEHKLSKELVHKLDPEGRALAKKAADAWASFADKDADHFSDAYRNGSLRPQVAISRRSARAKERRDSLRVLFDYALGTDDPAAAEKALDKEYKAAVAAAPDAENRKLLAAAQSAWRAYRVAEVAFYRRALGKKLDAESLAGDLRARLALRRAEMLKDDMSQEY